MPAIPPRTTPTSDAAWDGPANIARLKLNQPASYYRSAFAWVDANADPTLKGSYKFICHFVSADGAVGAASTIACSSGIAVLNGGRTGTTIPTSDKRGVYQHLAHHLRDAGKVPPAFKGWEGEDERPSAMATGTEAMRDQALHMLAAEGPWAMREEAFNLMAAAIRGASFDSRLPSPSQMAARQGAVAVVPIQGPIMRGGGLLSLLFGGTSPELASQMVRESVANPDVKAVLLNIDSPGGEVYGIQELADQIYGLRGAKPIVALANPLAASAAYWIASAADEVAVVPSGETGSIGVFGSHTDMSGNLAQRGVKVTLIRAGRYKVEGNPFERLTEEAQAAIQARVDEYYGAFVAAVARNRGTTPSAVRNGYGQGRVLTAERSRSAGLVDRVATFDQMLARLGVGQASPQRRQMGGNARMAALELDQRLLEMDFDERRHQCQVDLRNRMRELDLESDGSQGPITEREFDLL